MIVPSLALPLLVTVSIAAASTTIHRRLPPRLATRFVSVALVLVVVAALPTTVVVAVAFLAHVPIVGVGFEWCAQAIGLHGAVTPWLGVPSVALLAAGVVRTARVVRQHRTLRCDGVHTVQVARSHRPYAVTLPGTAGRVVISTAMFDLLDDAERRVVIAHERAHARYRHDRYLLVAELSAAAVPPLRALARRVTFSLERWADEAAARSCGDRELVAVTLGKVALQTTPALVAGFSGLGVAARMQALLDPPVRRPTRGALLTLWSSLAVAAGFSVYQVHHLEQLVIALCPH
jgi:Zn-dependent protease with chaperone function